MWSLLRRVFMLLCLCACAVVCPTLAKTPKQNIRQDIVKQAQNHIGAPYRRGGNTASGFDCSGLSQFVFKHHKISLPRSAREQYRALPKTKHPEPGDLVFFKINGRDISHVGIYAGNQSMIHAPRPGTKVRLEKIDTPYWQKHYVGAAIALPNTTKTAVQSTSTKLQKIAASKPSSRNPRSVTQQAKLAQASKVQNRTKAPRPPLSLTSLQAPQQSQGTTPLSLTSLETAVPDAKPSLRLTSLK